MACTVTVETGVTQTDLTNASVVVTQCDRADEIANNVVLEQIRIYLSEFDLASGIDAVVTNRSYADDLTATGAGLITGQVYYNTTSTSFVVLP